MASGSGRSASYLPRIALVLTTGALAAVGLTWTMLIAIVGPDAGEWLDRGPANASLAAAGAAAAASIALGLYRALTGQPDRVAAGAANALLLGAALLVVPSAMWLIEPEVLEPQPWRAMAPVVAAVLAGALAVAPLERRILHAIAIRLTSESLPATVNRTARARTLPSSFAGILTAAALTVAAVSATALLVRVHEETAPLTDSHSLVALAALAGSILVALVAGLAVGLSPARDVRSIARRLDALGYNTQQTMAHPMAVTSFDDLGLLLSELEGLRARLAGEVSLYQSALDRTRDADAVKASFLAAVSHELRTPLNSIDGFAQLMLEDAGGNLNEAQAEDVRLIIAGGKQLLDLLNDILDISMIESGELSLHFEDTHFVELAEEVVQIHQPLVRELPKKLVGEFSGNVPKIVCDRRRIGQVLNNLISNAIKFTEEGSITVRVSFDHLSQEVVTRVIDTGVGIAPDELDTVFMEFRQVGSLKKRAKGTGLGLHIARSIAKAHGGSLSVESEHGVGSTFILRLPIQPKEQPEIFDMTEDRARERRQTQENL